MPIINNELRTYLAALVILAISFISHKIVLAASIPNLLIFKCNGEVTIHANQEYEKLADKNWYGDLQRGYLFKEDFFFIDKEIIKYTNLLSRETYVIADLKENLGNDRLPSQIGYVSEEVIYFSARNYVKNLPVTKQPSRALFIYRLDRDSQEIQMLDIDNCGSPYFSVKEDHVFFQATNGEIHEFAEGDTTSLGIKGDVPSISPDGTKIAFVSFGFINSKIFLYDMKDQNRISLISFFGPKSVNPIIRWSENSEFIAVKQKSDFSAKPIYFVGTISGEVIQKVENSSACNWFLIDDKLFLNRFKSHQDPLRTH
jgi:hypothetical protein